MLHEGSGTADENEWVRGRRWTDSAQHLCVDTPPIATPVLWLRAGQGGVDVNALPSIGGHELLVVENALPGSAGEEQPRVNRSAVGEQVANHRHQRHEARATGDQQQRSALLQTPGEMPADPAADLELIAAAQLARQIGRDLAILDQLDRQCESGFLRGGGDRVGALRLIAVLGGEADVDVLAGEVSGPFGDIEGDRPRAGCLLGDRSDRRCVPADRRTLQLNRSSSAVLSKGRRGCGNRRPPKSPARPRA
jgi:hypothetical protein